MDRSTRRLLMILAGVGTTALVTRALLPPLLTRLLNRGLARMPGYRAKVDAVELNLVEGMVAVRGISVRQLSELDHHHSLYTRLVSLHVDWKSAVRGKLVAEIEIDNPRLYLGLNAINYKAARNGHDGRKGDEKGQPSWQQQVSKLYPFKLRMVRLRGGEVHIYGVPGQHATALRLEQLNVTGENITNSIGLSPTLMSKMSCQAQIMSHGSLALSGQGYPLAEVPTFDVDLKTENIDLKEFRSLIHHFLELEVRNGLMDLYVEAAAAHGQIRGYAKPIFDHLEIEPLDRKGFTAHVKAWGAELVAKLGRNERKDRVATRLSFEGALNDPQLDIAEAIAQFFRNSFLTALSASLGNRVWFARAWKFADEIEVVYRKPRQSRAGRIFALAKGTISNWISDGAPRMAASLSYYTMFSLAPLLILLMAIGGVLLGHQAAQGHIMGQLTSLLGRPGAAAVQSMIQAANKPAKGVVAAIISIIILVLGATGVLAELKAALNTIWKTQETGGIKEVVKRNVVFLGMILGIGFLLAVSLMINVGLAGVGKFLSGVLPVPEVVLQSVDFLVSFAIITVLFAAMFKFLPNTEIDWRDVWIGGAVTSFLFSIGKLLLGLYLGKGIVGSSYGAVASVLIVLSWVYYSGLILYLGAEFTRVYAETYGSRKGNAAVAAKRSAA